MNNKKLSDALPYGIWIAGLLTVLYLTSMHSYLLFHTFVEGFSVVVAIGMFMVAWHTRKYTENVFLLFLGVAYVSVAGIDILHLLAYRGMGIFSTTDADLATQFWVAARAMQSISLLLAPFFLKRQTRPGRLLLLYAGFCGIVIASILWLRIFPRCFTPAEGLTLFKKVSEYVIVLFFAGGLYTLSRNKSLIDTGTYRTLYASIIITMASEFSFTLYRDPYGFPNLLGHLFKIIGFFLTYRAIVVGTLEKPYGILFSNLHLANERLTTSEEHFRRLFELSGVGKAEADPASGRFVRVNRRFAEITGYSESELMQLNYSDITFPDDREEDRQRIDDVIQGKKTFWTTEKRYVRKDDAVIWVAVFGTVLRDNSGRPLYSIADIVDINERKMAEDGLHFHAHMLRQVEDMVIMIDTNQTITYMNRRAGEEYGIDPDTAVGKKITEVYGCRWISPGDEASSVNDLQTIGRWHGENIHDKKNGETIYVQSTVSVVRDEKGGISGQLAVMHNITSRKEAEQKILSVARFPEENPAPVMRCDKSGIVHYANKPAQVILDFWGCAVGARLNEKRCPFLFNALRSGVQTSVDFQYDNRWCSFTVVPVVGQEYINVYGRDITDAISFQQALQISERRYALAQQVANIGTWEWHIPTGNLHWSEQIEPMFGLKPGSFKGTHQEFMLFIHPDDRNRVTYALEQSIYTGLDLNIEHRITHPDGTVRWVRESAMLLLDGHRVPERMIGIVTDITRQYQAKQTLEKTVETQATVLADTREILVRVNEEKQETEKQLQKRQMALEAIYTIITSSSPSLPDICDQVVLNIAVLLDVQSVVFYQLIDGTVSLFTQVSGGVITHEQIQSIPCSACSSALEQQRPFQTTGNLVGTFRDSNCFRNNDFRAYIAVPVLTYQAEMVGVICVMRNEEREFLEFEGHLIEIFARYIAYEITRRNMQKKMLQSQEMHLLGQLTSGVAHEVRNPLNALMAISEALFKRIDDNETYGQYMAHIRNQIKRLSRLMEDLLALGRPLREDDFVRVAIGTMITDAVADWERISPDRNKRVLLEIPDNWSKAFVKVDIIKMQQVITNVLDNAEQHTPSDGMITIHVAQTEEAFARISIRNTGSSIAAEDLKHIFEPFFTTRKAGTGLGLSIVKTTIESHGGTISIANNDPPPGITVELRLPVSKPDQPAG